MTGHPPIVLLFPGQGTEAVGMSQGRAEVSMADSRAAYERYYERESTRYRLPLAIGAAFLALALWVGWRTEDD